MRITISQFLQAFPTPPLHHIDPQSDFTPWVFSENNPSSPIHNNIISSFSTTKTKPTAGYICQFWSPVTTGSKHLLSTSGHPFAVGYLSNEFAKYRQYSASHKYNMDVDSQVGSTFLNRMSCVNQLQWVPSEAVDTGLHVSVMLPVCLGSSSPRTCVGVLECTMDRKFAADVVLDVIASLKKAGLDVFPVQDLIPYKTINGLKLAKEEIDDALKVVCYSHDLALAQVWIASSRMKPLKLSGWVFDVTKHGYTLLPTLCDAIPSVLSLRTLEDHKSRFVSHLSLKLLIDLAGTFLPSSRAATVCLRSDETGDVDYVFEFIWTKATSLLLVAVLSTLTECLPRYKFASGEEMRDGLHFSIVGSKTGRNGQTVRVMPRKRSSPMPEEGNFHGSEISRVWADVEVDYGYDIFKFHLLVSEAPYENVVKEISKKLGLRVGTCDLEYLDEDEDWICVSTEKEMGLCIKSSRIRQSTEEKMGGCIKSLRIQMRVRLSKEMVIGPFGVLSI